MSGLELTALLLVICLAAALYSSVGHGGASGYLAAMVLFGVATQTMKPAALLMNIGVAAIASWNFWRGGHFRWPLFWPFAVASIPLAFVGGALQVPAPAYRIIVSIALFVAALRFILTPHSTRPTIAPPSVSVALLTGAIIGVISGMTGVGGGIFLSPLMLFLGWADTKQTAAISAVFIVVNSIAGLAGHVASLQHLPPELPWMAGAALAGGLVGSHYGVKHLPPATLRRLLGVVLIVAAVKFLLQK